MLPERGRCRLGCHGSDRGNGVILRRPEDGVVELAAEGPCALPDLRAMPQARVEHAAPGGQGAVPAHGVVYHGSLWTKVSDAGFIQYYGGLQIRHGADGFAALHEEQPLFEERGVDSVGEQPAVEVPPVRLIRKNRVSSNRAVLLGGMAAVACALQGVELGPGAV